MTPCIGPYSPVAAIQRSLSRTLSSDPTMCPAVVRSSDLGRRSSSEVPFPDRLTTFSPEFVADGTRYGTQKP
jgi:hypothetical protein